MRGPLDASARTSTDALSADAANCQADRVCFAAGLSHFGREGTGSRFEERPARVARLRAFELDQREVTAGAYARCVRAGRCEPRTTCGPALATDADAAVDGSIDASPDDAGAPIEDESPARCVRWADARAYCEFVGGRLPTEAEWERAAAGAFPEHRAFPWGESPGEDAMPEDRTPEGVRALAGGVAEWVDDVGAFYMLPAPPTARDSGADASVEDGSADLTDREFSDASVEPVDAGAPIVEDPRGPRAGPWRVVRGGRDGSPITRWITTARVFRRPDDRLTWVGFRCAFTR